MDEITALRELRPEPPAAQLEAMRLAARERFVAGTGSKRARPRWRLPALAGGLTAAAAATAIAALILASGQGALPGRQVTGHARTVVTAAWIVREAADGTVTVYLRQYADPVGLQHTLRADGVNAIVRTIPYALRTVSGKGYPACFYAATNRAPLGIQYAVVTIVKQDIPAQFIIHPGAMPAGSALLLPFMANVPDPATGNTSNWPMKPVVLNNDTVPACVPVTMRAPGVMPFPKAEPPPTPAPKAP
jgi:hypothetical protein